MVNPFFQGVVRLKHTSEFHKDLAWSMLRTRPRGYSRFHGEWQILRGFLKGGDKFLASVSGDQDDGYFAKRSL